MGIRDFFTVPLKITNPFLLTLWLTIGAFGTYFCMFAFRKPFTAGTFESMQLAGIDYKIILVVTQILGYAAAKGIGIKIISETRPEQRSLRILLVIGVAELALVLFGLLPPPYNWFLLFFNGLALGLVYGLVFGFLEGRRLTDLLGAGLCLSFIVASGVVKSVGVWMLNWGVSEYWMPAVVGLAFSPLLLLFVWMLQVAPPPTAADIAARKPRLPMTAEDRRRFFKALAPGLVSLILIYVIISMLRDIRDNFAVEIWQELGIRTPRIFSVTESWVGVIVTLLVGVLFIISSNRKAFWANLVFIALGIILIPLASWLYLQGRIQPLEWMIGVGLGIYLVYVPFNGMLFERLIAIRGEKANVGFLFYSADFAGYLGSVGILIIKNFGHTDISWLKFYLSITYLLPLIAGLLLVISAIYFARKLKKSSIF